MARASMKDLVGKAAPLETPAAAATAAAAAPAEPAPLPADSKRPASQAGAKHPPRISIEIDADLRRRFKNWANDNGTTISAELLRHIESLVG
ncbi:hypothetical protein ACFOYW_17000 [Gryllotalpicola reticulitermitis]|uniref:Uncharacterized protein n=1 Tax=Gryllotalpicola reticulitermitis TaxID=1184153 RepID=A0ABV8QBM1_9MICO